MKSTGRAVPAINIDENGLTYSATNTKLCRQEIFSPPFLDVVDYLHCQIYETKLGWRQFKEKTWADEIRGFVNACWNNNSEANSDKEYFQKQLPDLLNSRLAGRDKAVQILNYVLSNITINRSDKNSSFQEIFKNRQGQKYQVLDLLNFLFNLAGLQSTYILAGSAENGQLDNNFISFNQISAPGLEIMISGQPYRHPAGQPGEYQQL